MHRIDTPTAQADKFGPGKNGFTGGNPQTGRLPTALDQDFFDAVQEAIVRVIENAEIPLIKGDHGQFNEALTKLFLKSGNNFSEIKNAGAAAVEASLANLGIGGAAKLGVAAEEQMKEGTSETLIPSVMAVMSLFPKRTFSIPGFIRIPDVPGGLVIQWGNYVTSASSQDVNLPFTYSVAQVACVACYNGPASVYGYVTAQAKNTSQVTLHGRTSSGNPVASTFYVISIGF